MAGGASVFGAGVLTKAAHQIINAGVDLYNKIRKSTVKLFVYIMRSYNSVGGIQA